MNMQKKNMGNEKHRSDVELPAKIFQRMTAMISMKPDKDIAVRKIKIEAHGRKIPALVLSQRNAKTRTGNAPGVLWIHGGGYILGMKEMVHMGRAVDLVKKHGAVVVSPGYRLAWQAPYPAALNDCYYTLLYVKNHAVELGIREDQIMAGGESAGGGLCAALAMMARDRGEVKVAYQMPLYPMLDNFDTESSRDNHGRVWNTRRNHFGWRMYLGKDAKKAVPPYAAPARQTDFTGLPPTYTFVGDGEPFYRETLDFIENLKKAGVEADVDVYPSDMHAFDMLKPELDISRQAIRKFNEKFEYAKKHYFAG